MSYPKPLSEKSIEKLYQQADFSAEVRDFLQSFFNACANLYGAIALRDVWHIYGALSDAPKLRRKDLLTFSGIVRREEHSYYVFEVDELYSAESRNDLDRFIVSKELVSSRYGKFHLFYRLMEELDNKPYCVPVQFLSYAEPVPSAEETALVAFLSNLTSVTDECDPKHGKAVLNEHKGMKLGEFSFLNASERFEVEWLKKRPSALKEFLEDCSGAVSEKIMRFLKRGDHLGRQNPVESLQWLIDDLEEAGVEMTFDKVDALSKLVMDFHNSSHLWCLSGWQPNELVKMYHGKSLTAISFGPEMQKTFADGSLEKDELVREIRKMGLDVIE